MTSVLPPLEGNHLQNYTLILYAFIFQLENLLLNMQISKLGEVGTEAQQTQQNKVALLC